MQDNRLNEMLSSLPAERAATGFTQRVLARLDASERRPEPFLSRRWLLASTACAAIVLALGALWLREGKTSTEMHAAQAREALAEIRAEHARLRQEFQSLSTPAASPDEGLVYIGGNENVDLVVDPERVPPAPSTATPAAYRNETY